MIVSFEIIEVEEYGPVALKKSQHEYSFYGRQRKLQR